MLFFRLCFALLTVSVPLFAADVLSYHNNTQSTGVNDAETQLTPSSVTVSTFGKRFTTPVDGQVYAQPLYKAGVTVSGGAQPGLHNLVFAATQHDSLYAIDADSGAVVWQTSFLSGGIAGATGITTMPSGDTGSGDITPEIGVCGTPVIDGANGFLYVAAKTKQIVNNNTVAPHYVYAIYKIDITNGNTTPNANIVAVNIFADTINNGNYTYRTSSNAAAVQDPFTFGTGDGSINVGGTDRVYFNAQRQMNRPGLVLYNGVVYVAFASHGDNGPYHGWLLGFDASTLALQAALNTTPNGGLGGIWQAGGIPAMDASGNFYFETGNGTFDGFKNGSGQTAGLNAQKFPVNGNYGDCFVKISLDATTTQSSQNTNGWGLKIVDYFAPFNNQALNSADTDLGSGGCVVLPDSAGSVAHQQLLVGAGKEGKVYLIDRNNMGKFDAITDHVVQEQGGAIGSAFNTPAFFNGVLYYVGAGDSGKAFTLANGAFSASPVKTTPDFFNWPGSTPSISASGSNNGLVWMIDRSTSQLRAYSASDFSTRIWTSAQASGNRDALGSAIKFTAPTVADGHVFAGTANSLVAYGPPSPPTAAPDAPTGLGATAISGIEIDLAWTDVSTNEDGYKIEQSSNGVDFTEIATTGVNAQSYPVTGLEVGTTYSFRVRAFNSFNTQSYSAYSNIASQQTGAQVPTLDFSNGFSSSAGTLQFNGSAKILGNRAELTDASGGSESGSIWSKAKQDIHAFTSRFRFQLTQANADGFTFAIQNNSPIVTGNSGGSLGYEGIGSSIAIKFDIYPALSTTGLYTNGAAPLEDGNAVDVSGAGLDFHSGHTFDVLLVYSGTVLTEKITDTDTGAAATFTYNIDIVATVGGTSAFIGFTGGTGGATAVQDLVSWTYTVTPSDPPAAPSALVATPASGTQVNLTWADNSDIESGFKIESKIGTSGTWQQIGVTGANVTGYFDTALIQGTDYFYRVRATNGVGDSAYSGEAEAFTPLPPLTPSGAHTTLIASGQVGLAWNNNANNEDGYKVLRKTTTASNFAVIATLPPGSESYTDATVKPGTVYDYHIQAYNLAGYSDFTGLTVQTPAKVSVVTTDATAQESTFDTGTFTVTRVGDTSNPLTVSFSLATGAGQSAEGTRYTLSTTGGAVTIPAGSVTATITVVPLGDPAILGTQNVTLNLASGAGYDLGVPASATVQVFDPPPPVSSFAPFKGRYSGVIQSNPASGAGAGFLAISLSKTGGFSALLRFGDGTYRVLGVFDHTGFFSTSIPRAGLSALQLTLKLGLTNNIGTVSGRLFDGVDTVTMTAIQSTLNAKTNPALFAGKYTVLLQLAGQAGASIPGGTGYGSVTVDAGGALRFVGVLGDGTAISQGVSVAEQGVWPFFAIPYFGKGSVTGPLIFRSTPNVSDLDGTVNWFKPAVGGAVFYPLGFSAQVVLIGSHYAPPPHNVRVLNFPDKVGNGVLAFSAGGLSPALQQKTVTLGADNRVTLSISEPFKMTIQTSSGIFTGAFSDAQNNARSFGGAIFQKQNLGAGVFQGNGQAGAVELEAAP